MRGLIEKLFGDGLGEHKAQSAFEEEQVAAAALLVEAALSDGEFSDDERSRITHILERRFTLPEKLALDLLADAETKARDSVEWHGFTKVIKDHYDQDERVKLIELLWEVVLDDEQVHDYEASLIRRLCGLLYVSGRESAEARNRAKARLGID